jgi:hypothetical protein
MDKSKLIILATREEKKKCNGKSKNMRVWVKSERTPSQLPFSWSWKNVCAQAGVGFVGHGTLSLISLIFCSQVLLLVISYYSAPCQDRTHHDHSFGFELFWPMITAHSLPVNTYFLTNSKALFASLEGKGGKDLGKKEWSSGWNRGKWERRVLGVNFSS